MPTYNADGNIAALNAYLDQQEQLKKEDEYNAQQALEKLTDNGYRELLQRMMDDDACGMTIAGQDKDTIEGLNWITNFAVQLILSSKLDHLEPYKNLLIDVLDDAAQRIVDHEVKA